MESYFDPYPNGTYLNFSACPCLHSLQAKRSVAVGAAGNRRPYRDRFKSSRIHGMICIVNTPSE